MFIIMERAAVSVQHTATKEPREAHFLGFFFEFYFARPAGMARP